MDHSPSFQPPSSDDDMTGRRSLSPAKESDIRLQTLSPQPQRPDSARPRFFRSSSLREETKPFSDASSTHTNETEPRLGIWAHPEYPLRPAKTLQQQMLWSNRIDWYIPTAMIATFVIGVFAALGHHLYYASLNGKPAENQLLRVRFGTALAFTTKASLVGSVVLAYRQRLWHTVQTKVITMRGLDALFSLVEDPSWFIMSKEISLKAKIAALMAAASWLIPIASVLSPGSLTAEVALKEYVATCNVATINFDQERTADWRHPRNGLAGYDLLFYNTTPPPPADSVVDWYDQPSQTLERLVMLAVYTKQASNDGAYVPKGTPCDGYNCTYTITFEGPHYNCTEKSFSEASKFFNISDFVPNSAPSAQKGNNYVYYATWEDGGEDYKKPQDNFHSSAYTGQGTFHIEPKVWIGYAVNDTSKPPPHRDAKTRWNDNIVPHAVQCIHEKALYTVNTNFTSGRVDWNVSVSGGVAMLPDGQSLSPKPANSSVLPPVSPDYKVFAAYHALGEFTRTNILSGFLSQDNELQNVVTHSPISQTVLVDKATSWPVKNLPDAFERFYEYIVVSLITEPNLEVASNENVQCHKTRYENLFKYHKESLWIGYAISIFVAFIFVCLGLQAIRSNGFTTDTTFTKILVTTRNKRLDDLVKSYEGVSLGGDPFPRELQTTGLRFGVVDDDGMNGQRSIKHTAFGTVQETKPIRKEDFQDDTLPTNMPRSPLGDRGPWIPGAGLGAMSRM